MTYTTAAGVVVLGTLALAAALRTRVFRERAYWLALLVILAGQLVVNGLLTCRDIVTYAQDAILGPRIACAPIEDLGFGWALVTQAIIWWRFVGRRLDPVEAP